MTYQIPERSEVFIAIYNLRGQRIFTLVDGLQSAGVYQKVWDSRDELGREVASGMYLVRLQVIPRAGKTKSFMQIRKITLMR